MPFQIKERVCERITAKNVGKTNKASLPMASSFSLDLPVKTIP